jgi:hypothetical protein
MEFFGVRADISVTEITPDSHWESRHDLYKKVKRSRGWYMSLDPEQRAALAEKVRGSLAVMVDKVDEWLPDAFVGDLVGETIRIELQLVLADIDSAVAKQRHSSSYNLNKMAAKVEAMLEEMDE